MRILIFMIVLGCIGFACRKEASIADFPVFVKIKDYEFESSPEQGSPRHLFSEFWVYADSTFIGTYRPGATFPILAEGEITLDIFAGIREDAQADKPSIYNLVNPYRATIARTVSAVAEVFPTFRYHPKIRFGLLEDFESENHRFTNDLDGDTATALQKNEVVAFEGSGGTAWLSADHSLMEVSTNFPVEGLAASSGTTFLEMEYQSEVLLAVGVMVDQGNVFYKVILFPNKQPQKIYLNFTPDLRDLDSESYRIVFRAEYDDASTQPNQQLTIDNIKVLHFGQ